MAMTLTCSRFLCRRTETGSSSSRSRTSGKRRLLYLYSGIDHARYSITRRDREATRRSRQAHRTNQDVLRTSGDFGAPGRSRRYLPCREAITESPGWPREKSPLVASTEKPWLGRLSLPQKQFVS